MTERELFERLQDKPALRYAVARTPEESQLALAQYQRDYGSTAPSLMLTRHRRAELLQLLQEMA